MSFNPEHINTIASLEPDALSRLIDTGPGRISYYVDRRLYDEQEEVADSLGNLQTRIISAQEAGTTPAGFEKFESDFLDMATDVETENILTRANQRMQLERDRDKLDIRAARARLGRLASIASAGITVGAGYLGYKLGIPFGETITDMQCESGSYQCGNTEEQVVEGIAVTLSTLLGVTATRTITHPRWRNNLAHRRAQQLSRHSNEG